eukprot:196102_1
MAQMYQHDQEGCDEEEAPPSYNADIDDKKMNPQLPQHHKNNGSHGFVIKYVRMYFGLGGIRIQSKDENALKYVTNWYTNELKGRVKRNNQTCITLKEHTVVFKVKYNAREYHWTLTVADKLAEIGYEMFSVNEISGPWYFKLKL